MSLHAPLRGQTEVGLGADTAMVDDEARTGRGTAAWLGGFSAFLDGRRGNAQLDARLGWSPSLGSANGQLAAYLAAGYQWD